MNKNFLVIFLAFSIVITLLLTAGPISADSTTTVTVEVKDSQGNPLSGVKIWYKGGPISPGTWFVFGYTGVDGRVSKDLPSGYTYNFRAEYANTMAMKSQYVDDEPITVEFQTSKITVRLESSEGIGLKGGNVKYRGSISPGTWVTFGTTGDDGEVSRELFPGTYWFSIEYRQTYTEKQQDVGSDPTVVFRTTRVTLWFSGSIQYWGYPSAGTLFTFTKPSMEMLPGTIKFRFAGKADLSIDVGGNSIEKSIIIAKLLDHRGRGLAGGVAKYAPGGTWYYLGTTDSRGIIIKAFDGKLGYVKVRMTYNQGSREKIQYVPTNSIYTFQTAEVIIKVIDHEGNPIEGARVDQGGGYWQFHGYTDENGELRLEIFLPGTYKFRVTYSHTSQTKWAYITSISPEVVFQTGMVHWTGVYPKPIKASLGGTWVAFTQDMELLPGTYKFVFEDGSTQWVTVTAGEVTNIP